MNHPILSVRNLGKQYRLGARAGHDTLRDQIAHGFRRIFGGPAANRKSSAGDEMFWSLKDVSFDVGQGEVVGVIGRNGAGKSTLLKVLSQITEPSEGEVRLRGRVASLLEVGTGFHPELSGRENVFLNGAILGMSKAEIRRKFDEIVAFAEVERFLDTPVKRYSSGMYVRLAFAVAAHLDPEILIVDEVLAVGDASFQKKCLGRMREIGKEGRTVIFVSHNMSVVQSLCGRCLVMQAGHLAVDETVSNAVKFYLQDAHATGAFAREPQPNGKPTLVSGRIEIIEEGHAQAARIAIGIFSSSRCVASLDLRLADAVGIPVAFGSLGTFDSAQALELQAGSNLFEFSIPMEHFATGSYYLSLDLTVPFAEYYDRIENCLSFECTRHAHHGAVRVLAQGWGYGSFEIPLVRNSNSL